MTTAVADVDPVAVVVAALRSSAVVDAAFGGASHVSALNEPPYPHLRVVPSPGGDDGRLLWTVTGEVIIEAWGDPGGSPGRAALRRLLYLALTDLAALPEQPYRGGPVVVDVRMVGTAVWAPEVSTGQGRWAHTALVTLHPPN